MTVPAVSVAAEGKPLKRHPKCSSFYSVRSTATPDAAAAVPLTPAIAYLAHLRVRVSVSKALKGGPQYAMTVHDTKSNATWRNCRDFDAYRRFQSRLVAAMQRGHFCFAECPWLYSFAKRAFPKPSFFHYATPRVVELRRAALQSFVNTLQAVLLNRANHCCSVLTHAVAQTLVGFVTGDTDDATASWATVSPVAASGATMARTFSETYLNAAAPVASSASMSSATSDEDDESRVSTGVATATAAHSAVTHERECCAMCALHHVRSDEQVFSWWQAKRRFATATLSSTGSTASATSSSSEASAYNHGAMQQDDGLQQTHSLSLDLTLVSEPIDSPVLSLAATAVLGDDDADTVAMLGGHDGTPKEAYPGTPTGDSSYPAGWTTSSLASPPPHTLSFLRDDDDEVVSSDACPNPQPQAAAAQCKRGRSPFRSIPTPTALPKRLRLLPRRSLNALSSVSNALSQRLKPTPSPNTVF